MRLPLHFAVLAGIFAVEIVPSRASLATPPTSPAPSDSDSDSLNQSKVAQNLPPIAPPENLQPDPNQDRFLQPAPTPIPTPNPTESPVLPTPTSEPTPDVNVVPIQVNRIEVTGSTVLSSEQLNRITKPFEGSTVSFQELTSVIDEINKLYLEQGYTNSRAILEAQTIANGIVQIRVVEGTLEEIEVEGTRRLNPSYVRSRVNLGVGTPLNTTKLEEQLRLLRADPLFKNVEAILRSGSEPGQSILVVRVTEAESLEASVSFDNYSPPSVGSERLGINASYRNLTGNGDQLAASYYRTTTGGADVFDFSYRIPLNAMNGTLQLRAAPNRNEVTESPFDEFDIRGESQLYEISYRQPLIRSLREEFALSIGFAYQSGQTFTFAGPTPFGFGPDERGVSRTSVIKFGQDYLRWDSLGAWSLRSQFSFGTGLFNATTNPDSIPDGRFISWLGQVQRVQLLNKNNLLILQADLQLTPDALLPSQQFIIGGGQSLRGYRQNVRAGDNGLRFSVEERMTLQRDEAGNAIFQLAPFVDLGTIWNVSDNPNNLQKQRFLASVGLGLLWQPLSNLSVRLDYGLPLVNLDDRGENVQDSGFYFSVNYKL
jgi:hemolysin activation/secretion protein